MLFILQYYYYFYLINMFPKFFSIKFNANHCKSISWCR